MPKDDEIPSPETETLPVNDGVEPPAASWAYLDFIKATPAQIKAKTVECSNCPVFLLCESGEGGTGWVCPKCQLTGVYLDTPPDDTSLAEHVIVMDCTKHKFVHNKECAQMTECAVCSGGVMRLVVLNKGAKNHYIYTAHAGLPAVKRQATLRKGFNYWTKHYKEKKGG